MSSWEVEILPDAEWTLRELDSGLAERVVARLRWLAANLDVVRPQPLHGSLLGSSPSFESAICALCTRWTGRPDEFTST